MASMTKMKSGLLTVGIMLCLVSVATAQDRGSVTNLPLPRYVSLKAAEANARRGPSLTHRIDWVFKRRDMPLRITAEYENWRRVEDRDGAGGWVHYTLLSGARTGIVDSETVDLLSKPDPAAMVVARLEKGVVVRLAKCDPDWCALSAEGYKGWARKAAIWGVRAEETFE